MTALTRGRAARLFGCAALMAALLLLASYGMSERVAAQQPAEQVMHYRGNARRTGAFAAAGPRQMGGVRWRRDFVGATHGGPVFADGVIYIASSDSRLHAIASATGQTRWTFRAKPISQVLSSVAIAGGVVYVGIEKKRLYALDAQTGAKLWKFKTRGIVWTAPLVAGGVVYFASDDGSFYAVDAGTRQEKWKLNTGRRSLHPAVFDNGTVYFVAQNLLLAVDSETGQEKWRNEKPEANWWNPPALAEGILYAGNDDGQFYALNAGTGEVVWTYPSGGGNWSAPAIADGMVYAGNRNQHFYALNRQTGELAWQVAVEDWAVSDPIVSGGVVYFGVGNHEFPPREGPRHLYALDGQTGQELWKFRADRRILGGAAVGDGAVYFASFESSLYAIQ